MEVDGIGYIITANEGDNLQYRAGKNVWKEAKRGEQFIDGMLRYYVIESHCELFYQN